MFLGFENFESMAGSSKLTDGSALDCFKTLQELHKNGFSVKCAEIDHKLSKLFSRLVSRYLKQIDHSRHFSSLPPMLGDDKPVELLKLHLLVKEKGGYESVSKNGLWDLVAKESGFDSSVSTNLKLVYVKYLKQLDEWFSKVLKDNDSGKGGSNFMDLKLDFERFFADVDKKDEKKYADFKNVQSCGVTELCVGIEEEKELNRKRKKECFLPLLDWVKRVAKNPCDPAVGSLPDRSKWKAYGTEHVWKQVLLAKEAMLLNDNVDSNAQRSIWQKKQLKMHPEMYTDRTEKSTSRCSQRLISAKETRMIVSSTKSQSRDCSESSSTCSRSDVEDEDSFWATNYRKKRIPLGPSFQAKLPEWDGNTYQPETRWLGTGIWPLEKTEKRSSLIEMERIGKGKQDSCGCQFSNSLECVRFHVSEKRSRVKLELGSAFYKWKFDSMGEEEVSMNWTKNEEKMFENIIKSNPESSGTSFWVKLSAHFKTKMKPDLVRYYFNVYLLRRRAHQNRYDPSNVDSDDEELEKAGIEVNKCSGSIFCSPKKGHWDVT